MYARRRVYVVCLHACMYMYMYTCMYTHIYEYAYVYNIEVLMYTDIQMYEHPRESNRRDEVEGPTIRKVRQGKPNKIRQEKITQVKIKHHNFQKT